MVLVEEAVAGGTPRLGCPRDEQSELLLAGVAQPARVTVSENSLGSPCVGGTLSYSNITDIEVANAPELSRLPILKLQMHQSCPVGSLRRFPHGFRWCWSMRPKLGILHDWSVHVMIRIYGYWLEWRSWLV